MHGLAAVYSGVMQLQWAELRVFHLLHACTPAAVCLHRDQTCNQHRRSHNCNVSSRPVWCPHVWTALCHGSLVLRPGKLVQRISHALAPPLSVLDGTGDRTAPHTSLTQDACATRTCATTQAIGNNDVAVHSAAKLSLPPQACLHLAHCCHATCATDPKLPELFHHSILVSTMYQVTPLTLIVLLLPSVPLGRVCYPTPLANLVRARWPHMPLGRAQLRRMLRCDGAPSPLGFNFAPALPICRSPACHTPLAVASARTHSMLWYLQVATEIVCLRERDVVS